MYWRHNIPPGHPGRKEIFTGRYPYRGSGTVQRKLNFSCNMSEDTMNYALLSVDATLPEIIDIFVTLDAGHPVSISRALLAALIAPYSSSETAKTAYLDLVRVTSRLAQSPDGNHDYAAYLKTALAVLITAVEHGNAGSASLKPLAETFRAQIPEDAELSELLVRLQR